MSCLEDVVTGVVVQVKTVDSKYYIKPPIMSVIYQFQNRSEFFTLVSNKKLSYWRKTARRSLVGLYWRSQNSQYRFTKI